MDSVLLRRSAFPVLLSLIAAALLLQHKAQPQGIAVTIVTPPSVCIFSSLQIYSKYRAVDANHISAVPFARKRSPGTSPRTSPPTPEHILPLFWLSRISAPAKSHLANGGGQERRMFLASSRSEFRTE